jgi:Tfp pilus assembly protein PilF
VQAAIALFDKAIAADPQNPVAHLNKAVCTLQLTNDVHGAVEQLEKAVKVDPSFGAAITQLGQVCVLLQPILQGLFTYFKYLQFDD